MSKEDLVDLVMAPRPVWRQPPSIDCIPILSYLANDLKDAPLGKTSGADGLPNGIGVICPTATATCLHPIALKLCLRGVEFVGY